MRRILDNHARPRHAAKQRVDQEEVALLSSEPYKDIRAVGRTLDRLSRVDPRPERIVDLRYCGGLASEKSSQAAGVSIVTVRRDRSVAKAWLPGELAGPGAAP